MKYFIIPLFILTFLLSSCEAEKRITYSEKEVSEIHEKLFSIDTHVDTPLDLVRNSEYNLGEIHNRYKSKIRLDFPRMKEGGLDAAVFIVWTAQGPTDQESFIKVKKKADNILDVIKRSVANSNNSGELAYSTEDISRIVNEDKRAILIGMENGYPLGTDLTLVKKYYDDGIRYITLCHTKDNQLCSSSSDTTEDNGLTEFGSNVVTEMNKLGIIVDVSHVSDKAFFDVLKLTKAPIIASHSNARALCNHPRNMSNEMLKALAKNGGVVQVNFVNIYLKEKEENPQRDSAFAELSSKFDMANMTNDERDKFHAEMGEIDSKFPSKKATITDVINHIDYIAKLIGVNHVGIGSDFDGGGGVEGVQDVGEMKNITTELLKLGYSEEDVQKIWGGNFLRVFNAVEKYSNNNG
jgi:membrane dipeptidase